MKHAHIWEDDPGKGYEKDEEGDGAGVEYVFLFHAVAEFTVECGETNCCLCVCMYVGRMKRKERREELNLERWKFWG